MMWYGKFVSTGRFIQTYLGFFILVLLIVGVTVAVRFGVVSGSP
jgi:hypothetical protein